MKSKNLNIIKNGDLVYIQFPLFSASGCVRHIFSTRHGGVSVGDAASMNLSFDKDSSRENVLKNFDILCNAVGIAPENLVLSKQTHTDCVVAVDGSHCGTGITKPSFNDVDGLITDVPGVALVTQYADCTPLLFCDVKRKVIATSHSGWRGTVKQIGRVTVEKMMKDFGCNPSDIIAGIGPSIGQCCYEVDDPVYNEFEKLALPNSDKILLKKDNGRYMLDLVEANYQILLSAGIKPHNIDRSDICTCCNHTDLHSHRATKGKRGTLAAIIELV